MNRKTSVFAAILLGLTPFLLGQQDQNRQAPRSGDELLQSQQLIAWSSLQNPRPVPQPLPPPDKNTPQPDPPSQQAPSARSQDASPAQNFTGKIVSDGQAYVLKASGKNYQLDDQNSAKQYDGKDVKIVGSLDAGSNTIHIVRIESIS